MNNPNHPQKGSTIKVDPIRKLKHIEAIKELLKDNKDVISVPAIDEKVPAKTDEP